MNRLRVKIEIPRGSNIKYELDKESGEIRVDRILSQEYPFNYGFAVKTHWHDGDPLDVFVLGNFTLHPGVILDVKPLGVVMMSDNGVSDFKLVCALGREKFADHIEQIEAFLSSYKKGVEIEGYTESDIITMDVIAEACQLYADDC